MDIIKYVLYCTVLYTYLEADAGLQESLRMMTMTIEFVSYLQCVHIKSYHII